MINVIEQELNIFENEFKESLKGVVNDYLFEFVFKKSKRLRPLLGILFAKALGIDLSQNHKNLFMAVELIHNASLIHDDVIDKSEVRREGKSLNEKFDNSLAVSSGDILLALGMKNIINIDNKDVQKMISENMFLTCQGEISQYFSKFKTPSIEEYIEKSRKKTALLFEISILGGIMLSDKKEFLQDAKDFAQNFGISFQIKNDLKDFTEAKEDYQQGIYTSPDIIGIEKTKDLINNYLDNANNIIKDLPKNEYSEGLENIVKEMRIN